MSILSSAGPVNSSPDGGQPATGGDGVAPAGSPSFFASAFKSLLPAFWLTLAWVVMFELLRVLLIIFTWSHHGDATMPLIWQSLLRGVRYDLAIAAWLVLPFALWWIWRGAPGRGERRFVFGVFALIALVGIFALIAEVEFYKEFQMRLGPLAYEYFSTKAEHNAIVVGMVWHGYPVVRWTLACLAGWAVFVWVARRQFLPRANPTGLAGRAVATLILAGVGLIAIRGGLQHTPLRWGNAYFSPSTYVNQMTGNGLWSLMDAARHSTSGTQLARQWKRRMPVDEAIKRVREIVLLPDEKLVEPEKYPLLRVSPPNDAVVKRPRNVVVVIMESFTARFNDAIGAPFGATPQFAALAKEGILFDRAFSAGTHTAQGVFATLCSFPNLPDYERLAKGPVGEQPFRSLPQIFLENGYETLFLYNGLFSWDNKQGFYTHQGVQRFIGQFDFKNPTFVDKDWGPCDFDVFNRAIEEFSDLAAKKKRFFGIVLTLSNHAPFDLPKIEGLEPITTGGEQNKRLNGVHYADWAVGQFMASARKQEWFDDTLFVFVGDHGFGIPPNLTEVSLLHMHVPLLFYAPALFGGKHEVRHQTVGQMDILPSIVGLAGFSTPHQAFGRDLFRLPADEPGHAYVKRIGEPMLGWIEGNEILVGNVGAPAHLHTLDLGFPPSASDDLSAKDPEKAAHLLHKLDAFVVTGLNTIERRLAAPQRQ
ncbi:MAG: LTA synthase family protein [Verrucomicrobia bacterium]|nr:LTA synthase family protein [Verrucomicrobiota bacterium]